MSVNYLRVFFEFIVLVYEPSALIMSILFFYCDSFLRTLSVSIILVLSIGKICSIYDTKLFKIIKWTVYIWFIGYSIYTLGIIENIYGVDALDWSTFAFSVIAPISMVILGRQISAVKVKGHKIFIYHVNMMIYFIVSLIWWFYVPESANFPFLFTVWLIVLFVVSIFSYVKGG